MHCASFIGPCNLLISLENSSGIVKRLLDFPCQWFTLRHILLNFRLAQLDLAYADLLSYCIDPMS